MHFFLPVLFALVCCVAEDLLEVQLVPSLHADRHNYFVVTKCPNDANDNNKLTICYSDDCQKSSSNTFDLVEMKVASTNCPKEYEIIVGMCNKNKQDWTTWPSVYSANIVMQMHENFKIHHITFGNHFKLAISPAFSEHSKMVYRVNVYCAGIDQYEFKTYTNYATMVVFNSDQRKCDKYDVKVWSVHLDLLDKAKFNEPALVEADVTIENGEMHNIYFSHCFNLSIYPPLMPSSAQIYFAVVKCHGIDEAQKYRTFTDENAQIVLNAEECADYDINVWRFNKELLKNVLINSSDSLALDNNELNSLRQEWVVKIPNGHTYQFNYVEELPPSISTSSFSNPIKKEFKRMYSDIEDLKRDVTGIKKDVEELKGEMETGISTIGELLTKRLKEN